MLDGFGCLPVRLNLDFDSYEGPWTHVYRFRNRSGWLVVAEAHLTSGAMAWDTTVVAACDDCGEAVPGFMAPSLLACACSLPEPCEDPPPEELEELLREQCEPLASRWLRQTNRELAVFHDRNARRIEAMEGRTHAFVAAGERQIAELRRRRRMGDADDQARETIDRVIQEIEADHDAALDRLAARRAELRKETEARERALLTSINVRVALDPLYYVNWHDASRVEASDEHPSPHPGAWTRPTNLSCAIPTWASGPERSTPWQRRRRLEAEMVRLEKRGAGIDAALARSWELDRAETARLRRDGRTVQALLKAVRVELNGLS